MNVCMIKCQQMRQYMMLEDTHVIETFAFKYLRPGILHKDVFCFLHKIYRKGSV